MKNNSLSTENCKNTWVKLIIFTPKNSKMYKKITQKIVEKNSKKNKMRKTIYIAKYSLIIFKTRSL